MMFKSAVAAVILFFLKSQAFAAGTDMRSEVQLLLKSPDAQVSGTFDLPAGASLVEALLRSPLLVAHLWAAYEFGPHYQVSMQGDAIHIDDPTGIQGNVYLVEQGANRRVYYGTGALNHEFVPAFQGRMALVLTTTPKVANESARVEIYIRTESRVLGLLAWTLFPLVRSKAEHRLTANVQDLCTILHDLTVEPHQTVSKLKDKADAVALTGLLASATKTANQPNSQAAPKQSPPPKKKQCTPLVAVTVGTGIPFWPPGPKLCPPGRPDFPLE